MGSIVTGISIDAGIRPTAQRNVCKLCQTMQHDGHFLTGNLLIQSEGAVRLPLNNAQLLGAGNRSGIPGTLLHICKCAYD
ncbi:hypothetical protein D3C78_1843490 [compost metagenome]